MIGSKLGRAAIGRDWGPRTTLFVKSVPTERNLAPPRLRLPQHGARNHSHFCTTCMFPAQDEAGAKEDGPAGIGKGVGEGKQPFEQSKGNENDNSDRVKGYALRHKQQDSDDEESQVRLKPPAEGMGALDRDSFAHFAPTLSAEFQHGRTLP